MKKPWYIEEYEDKDYLHNKKLQLKDFKCKRGEHMHCELCWARFSNVEFDEHSGYYETESKSWICKMCYNNFKDLFKWSVETDLV